jgi:hypothetical protein
MLPGQTLSGRGPASLGPIPSVMAQQIDDEETVSYGARVTSPALMPHLGTPFETPADGEPRRTTDRGMPAAPRVAAMLLLPQVPPPSSEPHGGDVENAPVSGMRPARRPPPASPDSSHSRPARGAAQRSFAATLLFWAVAFAALAFLATGASIRFHLPWLDPRPLLARIMKFALEHAPSREPFGIPKP